MTSKLPVIILLSILGIGGLISTLYPVFMTYFMGAVLIALSLLKLLDIKGFAKAFSLYDLIAMHIEQYGYIYPFIELGLGIAFFTKSYLSVASIILISIMAIGLIGVTLELRRGRKINCACMGTKIKVPLTVLTITENTVMIVMALLILL